MVDRDLTISEFTSFQNSRKTVFTPGPGPILPENVEGLRPCFGRGDPDFEAIKSRVVERLKVIAGQTELVSLQGSASFALEIACRNFLHGKVVVLDTGFYGRRLLEMAESSMRSSNLVKSVSFLGTEDAQREQKVDWLVACVTETSLASIIPVARLKSLADALGAKLLVDATASIGLEDDHNLADVVVFSSCKGLFGLTGGAFVAYSQVESNKVDSFSLSLETHRTMQVTGPYHAICSLDGVLPRLEVLKAAVRTHKSAFLREYEEVLVHPMDQQPLLCTQVSVLLYGESDVVMYSPRGSISGSIVCHLTEAHLGTEASGISLRKLRRSP